MIKQTRTYVDYNGNERTEDLYFNLNKAELIEMQYTTPGGFAETLDKIVKTNDQSKLVMIMKDILLKSVGKKSEDGRFFKKSEEISKEFSESPVFADMFIELATDADKASKFIEGILPDDFSELENNPALENK